MSVLTVVIVAWTVCFALIKVADFVTRGSISTKLSQCRINVRFGVLTVSTRRWNSSIERVANRYRRFLRLWFTVGAVCGFVGMLLSVALLSSSLISAVFLGANFQPNGAVSPTLHPVALSFPDLRNDSSRPHNPGGFSVWRILDNVLTQGDHKPFQVFVNWYRSPQGGGRGVQMRDGRGQRGLDTHWARDPSRGPNDYPASLPGGLSPKDESMRVPRRGTDPGIGPKQQLHRPSRRLLAAINAVGSNPGIGKPGSVPNHSGYAVPRVNSGERKEDATLDVNSSGENRSRDTTMRPRYGVAVANRDKRPLLLTPLVPGITIPSSDIGYIVVAVLVSAVVHELGHALAAGIEEARVDSVGCFLALGFPGAFVQLSGLKSLSPIRQLRVWCAGAWHNAVLSLGCMVAVSCLPMVLSVFYNRGEGALVVDTEDRGPLFQFIHPGDVVLSMGRFPVKDGGRSFREAIVGLEESRDNVGFCVSEELYSRFAHNGLDCCNATEQGVDRPGDQCFEAAEALVSSRRRACMSPGAVSSRISCRTTMDCASADTKPGGKGDAGKSSAEHEEEEASVVQGMRSVLPFSGARHRAAMLDSSADTHRMGSGLPLGNIEANLPSRSSGRCFLPVLPRKQQLIDIRVKSIMSGKVSRFYYQGYPHVIAESLSVSSYVPRFHHALPRFAARWFATWDWPNIVERQLQYVASVSLALGILNMAPVFWLDGEASSVLFVQVLFPRIDSFRLSRLRGTMLMTGTTLLTLNVLLALID